MANYGYIRDVQKISSEDFLIVLKQAVQDALGDGWKTEKASFEEQGPAFVVSIPGSAIADPKLAMQKSLPPGQDMGFMVSLQKKGTTVAFRHSPNYFESWAQGCVEEQLADHFQVGVYYDSINKVQEPGNNEHRKAGSFKGYLLRNYKKPLTDSEELFVSRFKDYAPDGHWES